MLFTNTERRNFAKDPAVIRFHGEYFLYYTALAETDKEGFFICVGIARSADGENWTLAGYVPTDEPYEQKGVGAPAAIVLDGQVHLFYQTYGGMQNDALCHAVSDDGVNFRKNPENPVFRPHDTWCCGRAIDADVCLFDGKLFLYYATRDHAIAIQKVGVAYADADSGFGRDAWHQPVEGAALAPEFKWEGQCIEAPATVVNRGQVFMFYGGSYNCTPQQIGCAVSDDGVFFRKLFTAPFIPCGEPGTWNSSESGHPYAFRDNEDNSEDGKVYLYYQGSADGGKTWYLSRAEIGFDEKNMPFVVNK